MNDNNKSPSLESKTNGKKGIIQKLKPKFWRKCSEQSLKSDLEDLIQEHEEGGNAALEESEIIRNVLRFGDSRVTDVMTPRTDICAISADTSLEDIKKFIIENEHTRLPVFRENLDDIIGFIHIKDLIAYWDGQKQFKIHDILRDVLFVPASMKLQTLLVKMQAERTHMAIVVDEYGGSDGLVTIEDIVEEIVGEIEDEHDEEDERDIIKLAEHVYEVDARFEVADLEEELNTKIYGENEEEDFDTIGGLIFTSLGKVPKIGEQLKHKSGITFKIVDADKRKIKRVKIIMKQGD